MAYFVFWIEYSAGVYIAYQAKEEKGYPHFQSAHARAGAFVMIACAMLGMAGGVFLHPDFGIDKTNKLYRAFHKWAARIVMIAAWFTAFFGVMQVTEDPKIMAAYGIPLLVLTPFTLM